MKIQYRLKRTTRQYIIVAILCILVIGGAAGITIFVITEQITEEYQTLLNNAHQDMAANQREVYVTTANIRAGEALTKYNVKKAFVYSSQPQESYIKQQELGKLALIDIPTDTQVISTMLTDNTVAPELRELEYQVINVNSNIINNDTVDIRIVYPNGESYIVLSKKMLKGINEGSISCFLWMNEEEILRMSAAIVDAALYTGSQLVTSKYIEPSIQEASKVTYAPSIAILSLLERDPNILDRCSQELIKEVRKALENRLASSMSLNVSDIKWKVDPEVGAVDFPESSTGTDRSNTEISAVEQGQEYENNSENGTEVNKLNDSLNNTGNSSEIYSENSSEIYSENGTNSNTENSLGSSLKSGKNNSSVNSSQRNSAESTDKNTETDRTNANELGTSSKENTYFGYAQEDEVNDDYIEYGE